MNAMLPAVAHAGNAVILRVDSDPFVGIKYKVEHSGAVYYSGSGQTDSDGSVDFNIKNIVRRLVRSADVESKDVIIEYPGFTADYTVTVERPDTAETVTAAGSVVCGCIGNDIFRRLVNAGTDIFEKRLLNIGTNRILTTRTETGRLYVRETELMPLRILTLPTDRLITVKAATAAAAESFPLKGKCCGLHLANVRKRFFDRFGEIFSEFQISVDGKPVCTVTVTGSGHNRLHRVLRYRNSLGAYEAYEVTGTAEYVPELTGAEEHRRYDKLIDDYSFERDRLSARDIYTAQCGYKNPDELSAMRDLLMSDDVWLIAGGVRYGVIPESAEPLLAYDDFTPGSIELKIKLKDESFGIELNTEYLFPVIASRWENPVCAGLFKETYNLTGLWSDYRCAREEEPYNLTGLWGDYRCAREEEPYNLTGLWSDYRCAREETFDPATKLTFEFTAATTLKFKNMFVGNLTQNINIDFGNGETYLGIVSTIPDVVYAPGTYIVSFNVLTAGLDVVNDNLTHCRFGNTIFTQIGFNSKSLKGTSFERTPYISSYSIGGFFPNCTSLTFVPSGLFDNCPNLTDCFGTFQNCTSLTSIPDGLFDNCPKVENFGVFLQDCVKLTAIPDRLFDNCPKVEFFYYSFQNCTSLTSIPDGLFDNCPAVVNFGICFADCTSLISIPEGLFDNCLKVQYFSSCFKNCTSLTSIPDGLFDNCPAVINFSECFADCVELTGNAPELWTKYPTADGSGCFRNCTKLANYAAIPSNWK